MKIKKLLLKNFRAYGNEISIDFENLTALVGPNDIGKTSILEALNLFFNESSVKIEDGDFCISKTNEPIEITVEFSELPESIVIDSQHKTTLLDEFLVTLNNTLKIKKVIDHSKKSKVFVVCNFPSNSICKDLLSKKINDLKSIISRYNIKCTDLSVSSIMRQSIYSHFNVSNDLREQCVDISSQDGKNIYNEISNYFPIYTLFKADRSNNDSDSEVQDPMKQAVKQIFQQNDTVKTLCRQIEQIVTNELTSVANDTIEKLNDFDSKIASSLTPTIPNSSNLKWTDVFKSVSINSENEIPLNKRGSGVKRLVLISFFRAQAERIKNSEGKEKSSGIIYAIEEPETSQHIKMQKILIESLLKLSRSESIQIIFTTHSSFIVKQMSFNEIRIIRKNENFERAVNFPSDNFLPYPSLNEVNYTSFGDASEEYHDELYGYLWEQASKEFKQDMTETKFDDWLVKNSGGQISKYKEWKRNKNNKEIKCNETLQTYIRNFIHHPENKLNQKYSAAELENSLLQMRDLIKKINSK